MNDQPNEEKDKQMMCEPKYFKITSPMKTENQSLILYALKKEKYSENQRRVPRA